MVMEMVSIDVEPVPELTQSKFLTNAGIRFTVFWRDGFTCVYCGRSRLEAPRIRLNLDHVLPTNAGGTDDFDNLVTACAECNAGKRSSILSEQMIAFIKTIIKQNNARFLELTDRNTKFQLEYVLGHSLGRKVVKVRWDGEVFQVIGWYKDWYAQLKHLDSGRVMVIEQPNGVQELDPNLVEMQEILHQHGVKASDVEEFTERESLDLDY